MNHHVAAALVLLALPWQAWGQLNVEILSPQPDQIVGDSVTVSVRTNSPYQLRIDATYAGRTTTITNGGTLDLTQLTYGSHSLNLLVQDAYGQTGSAGTTFFVDRPPTLTVQAPLPWTVARPLLRIVADCFDDNPGGCSGMRVELGVRCPHRDCAPPPIFVHSTGSHLETEVDVGVFAGLGLVPYIYPGILPLAQFSFKDSILRGPDIPFLVDRSPRLREVVAETGRVLDYDGNRVLHLDDRQGSVSIHDLHSDTQTTASIPASAWAPSGAFVDPGAIVSLPSLETSFIISDGGAVALGGRTVTAGGHLAALRPPTGGVDISLFDLDPSGGTNLGYLTNKDDLVSISASGVVAYAESSDVWRRTTAGTTRLGTVPNILSVKTDGVNVVANGSSGYTVFLEDGGVELLPGRDAPYAAAGGWVGYIGPCTTDCSWQAFVRAPDGGVSQQTYLAGGVSIRGISPEGQLLFSAAQGTYLTNPDGGVPELISETQLGRPVHVDGGWAILMGRHVFAVSLDVPPYPLLGEGDGGGNNADAGDGGTDQGPGNPCGCQTSTGLNASVPLIAIAALLRWRRRGVRG